MDLATLIGMALAWGALIGSLLMEGGEIKALINLPAALLVFGGTFGAATVSFKMSQIASLPGVLTQAFTAKTYDIAAIIQTMVRFAERARREGLLVLEEDARKLNDEFLQRGMRLAIDGTEPELVREILTTEIHFLQAQHRVGENIFTTLGGFAPTLGIIGTVMGLIHMLANLSDPAKMGPLIAGAFIATLYGVSSANLIFLPIGNKLKARSAEEIVVREIMVEGILAIQAGDNPRIVEEKLKAFLTPDLRARLPNLYDAARRGEL
ncbi:MAG TPA: flagellar motor protein [Chthonomonadaceae bacterium]|nr:flagellar motor protein [Chthonomonadaceae bacterium]